MSWISTSSGRGSLKKRSSWRRWSPSLPCRRWDTEALPVVHRPCSAALCKTDRKRTRDHQRGVNAAGSLRHASYGAPAGTDRARTSSESHPQEGIQDDSFLFSSSRSASSAFSPRVGFWNEPSELTRDEDRAGSTGSPGRSLLVDSPSSLPWVDAGAETKTRGEEGTGEGGDPSPSPPDPPPRHVRGHSLPAVSARDGWMWRQEQHFETS